MEKLPKSSMAFELKDGTKLFLSDEDIEAITMKMIGYAARKGMLTIETVRDSNATKADTIIRLMSEQPNMDEGLKRQCLEKVLELLSTKGQTEKEITFENGNEVKKYS